ncbi:uncharacterized protein LOC124167164 isoform X2 [Ischnura elegans]|uniref:uncharacterized protein LOC124167164 isoform X2 n=1 Tax=Ischnura elegans TaxID=197161 RepID=UPI001ED88841|nr:uncharacterized protein LOC124167164 isoform X2 [Ischnura elegans]
MTRSRTTERSSCLGFMSRNLLSWEREKVQSIDNQARRATEPPDQSAAIDGGGSTRAKVARRTQRRPATGAECVSRECFVGPYHQADDQFEKAIETKKNHPVNTVFFVSIGTWVIHVVLCPALADTRLTGWCFPFDRISRISLDYLRYYSSFWDSTRLFGPLTGVPVAVQTDPMHGYLCRSASRARRPSRYKLMAARAMWMLRCAERQIGLLKFLRTLAIFVLATVFLAPTLAYIHILVSIGRAVWLRVLRWRFPESQFEEDPCIRSAMDTYRTQGVVALLLQIKGTCDPEAIAERLLNDVVMRKEEDFITYPKEKERSSFVKPGRKRLAHPQLSMVLTTRWGRYAWEKPKGFNIEKHVVLANSLFRGRPVTEFNVQECVSDIVSKYLPPDIPPWQATIIPVFSPEERYFILFRLHHLACKGHVLEHLQKAMSLGNEFSLADPLSATESIPQSPPVTQDETPAQEQKLAQDQTPAPDRTPAPPSVSPPSPDKLCAPPPKAVRSFTSYVREKTASAWSEITSSSSISQALYSMAGITLGLANEATRIARGQGMTYKLAREAIAEALFLTGVAFEGPNILLRELLPDKLHPHDDYLGHQGLVASRRQSGHYLQSVSLCGRKAIAWSDPISCDLVGKIAAATGTSQTEVLLAAASGALRHFFRQTGMPTPCVVTAAMPLPLTSKRDEGGGGFALIALPTKEEDSLRALEETKKQLRAQKNRPASLLLSSWLTKNAARILPSFGIRLLLNALTKKYSVTISNIPGPTGSDGFRLWGQEVEGFIIWRPQQANTSVSLSLMTYKGTIRLGVMADQQLSPQHSSIATAFGTQISDLALSAGVPRERLSSASNRPSAGSPWISPLATPRPSPRPSPKPSPKTSPEPSPPIVRRYRLSPFLQLPDADGQSRRRRGDSEGSSGCGGDDSDNSLSAESAAARQRRQDEERAKAFASAVADKFPEAVDSN